MILLKNSVVRILTSDHSVNNQPAAALLKVYSGPISFSVELTDTE